jgi:hypothetical protein
LAQGPKQLTAAQVAVLVDALRQPAEPPTGEPQAKPLQAQPHLDRAKLLAIAAAAQAGEMV